MNVQLFKCEALAQLTAPELERVEDFDAALERVRHWLGEGGAQMELWWGERTRRIVAGASAELWRVEMSSFAWGCCAGHSDLDALEVEDLSGGYVAALVTVEQAGRARDTLCACYEEVGEGTWAEETEGESWGESIQRQGAALCGAITALETLTT